MTEARRDWFERLGEQMILAFASTVLSMTLVTGGHVSASILSGAGAAAVRAAYGYVVKDRGSAVNEPSLK